MGRSLLVPSGNGHSKVAAILDGDFYQAFTSIPCFFCVIRVTCLIVTVCPYHLCSQEEEKYPYVMVARETQTCKELKGPVLPKTQGRVAWCPSLKWGQ